MLTVILTLIVIGVLITIHEFGHFLAAKLSGVRVKRFSIGFGPPILKKKIGETEFVIAVIPFGGYVDMAGSDPRPDQNYEKDEFLGQPAYKKLFIVFSGPFFNLLLGFVLFWISYAFYGVEVPPGKKILVVNDIQQLKPIDGGELLEVNGIKISSWLDVYNAVSARTDSHLFVVLKGQDTLKTWVPDSLLGYITARIPPVVARVQFGMPAYKAGIQPGDTVIGVNGAKIDEWYELVDSISAHPGDTVLLEIKRNGAVKTIPVVPMPVEIAADSGRVDTVGRIGIIAPTARVRISPVKAISMALTKTWDASLVIFRFIEGLFTGRSDYKQIGGPITIGKLVGDTTKYGFDYLLMLVALLSINLFLINLLPFPALDGWHILVFFVEGVFRRRMPAKAAIVAQYIGFAFLLLLTIAVLFLDVKRFF